jgi:hypothetical protein
LSPVLPARVPHRFRGRGGVMGQPCWRDLDPERIPDEAWTAAGVTFLAAVERATTTGDFRDVCPGDLVRPPVRAAAPLIVAAELRRLVTQCQPRIDPCLTYGDRWHREGIERVCATLTERATELDPAGDAR